MPIALFTNRLAVRGLASLMFAVAVLVLAAILDWRNTRDFQKGMEAALRGDPMMANTALLGRRMADLESLSLVSCLTIRSSRQGEVYSTNFKSGCERPRLIDLIRWVDTNLESSSGETFNVRYRKNVDLLSTLYLASILALGLLAINSFLGLYWSGLDKKDVEMKGHKALSDLASQVSHDIRSPLSALNVAISQVKDSISPESRAVILRVSARIQSVADDLLSKQRLDKPEAAVASEAVDLSRLLTEAIAEKRLMYQGRPSVEFKLDLGDGKPVKCWVDEREICRAISNMINNSVEAIADAGEVVLGLRHYADGTAEVSVRDTGAGIPDEIMQQIGVNRVSYGNKTDGSGSGLGLLHAKQTVEKLGGQFTIHSKVGRGTLISMKFPAPLRS